MRSLCMGKYFYDTKGNIISQEKFIRQGTVDRKQHGIGENRGLVWRTVVESYCLVVTSI